METNHTQLLSELQRLDRKIGATLRDLRKKAGLSLQQMAEYLGCSYQQVQKYESGRNRLSAPRLLLALKVLKADMRAGGIELRKAPPETREGMQEAIFEKMVHLSPAKTRALYRIANEISTLG